MQRTAKLNQTSSPIPDRDRAEILLDFDGTMTCGDVLDEMILRFAADDSWQAVERLWQCGRIGSRECLQREFMLLQATGCEIDRLLDEVRLDPGCLELLKLLEDFEIPTAILSDGIDRFILRILSNHGIEGLTIRANSVALDSGRLALHMPHSSADCESDAAHCKCASALRLHGSDRRSIYIGDGRSDLCPARKADFVFAKGALATNLDALGRPYRPFATLRDVSSALQTAWNSGPGSHQPAAEKARQ